VRLTTTQVSLIAAGIALAAPVITYRAGARLDRDRWVRERRAETYIAALAVLGRIAAYVASPATRADPTRTIPDEQWREFQARVEAFATTDVVALRDRLLVAWNRWRAAAEAAAAGDGADPEAAARREEAERLRTQVHTLYADLISQVREELKPAPGLRWRRRPAGAARDQPG
jgi:hypothetical protein